MNRFLVGLLALGLAACGSTQSVTIERVSPGAECKAGGFKVVGAGPEQLVCNGTSGGNGDAGSDGSWGAATLLAQSALPAGDGRCISGGVEVRAGFDSGADGGTAGDGVLQPGEVSSTGVVCAGDDAARVGSLTPPPGANGTATVRALGGLATAGFGGQGGRVELRALSGTNGGHLKAFRTGHADASFTVPTPPAADLGPVPLAITTNTSIAYATQPSTVAAGTAYQSGQSLFISRGPTLPADRVTGLSVAAGATLTLPLGTGTVVVPRSCRVEGTLRGDPLAILEALPALSLSCGDVVFSASSKVLLSPLDSQSGEHSLEVTARGALLALGVIDTSGYSPPTPAAGTPTGGGAVTLRAGSRLYLQGSVVTTAGSGAAVFGPAGGDVQVVAALGLYSAASIEASAGRVVRPTSGALLAGHGGAVSLSVTDGSGELRNRGAITSNGGVATDAAAPPIVGIGGAGGTVALATAHGPLTSDAVLTARGGDGNTQGGRGGSLSLGIAPSSAVGAFGAVLVSGALDASGGTGNEGGGGGDITLQLEAGAALGAELALLGYESVDVSGGVGLPGGSGGSVLFEQNPFTVGSFGSVAAGPGGAVLNTVALRANGGEADPTQVTAPSNRLGGIGGNIELRVQRLFGSGASFEALINAGELSANGGSGPTGGQAGSVALVGSTFVSTTGAISTRGGAGSTEGGGSGGNVTLSATGGLTNTGPIDASAGLAGGGGVARNGEGGDILLVGGAVTNTATLTARGGAASLTLGTGGDGGSVTLASSRAATQNTVPAPAGIVVSGGTAAKPGQAGAVLIDGLSVTDVWTH